MLVLYIVACMLGVVLVSTGILKYHKPSADRIYVKRRKLNINADETNVAMAA